MRLPFSSIPLAARMQKPLGTLPGLACACLMWGLSGQLAAQLTAGSDQLRAHDSAQWREVEEHLPDPRTATPQMLELQADILRARRFPEDAMDFYRYALDRGAKAPPVLNKLGLTELELKNIELARMYFRRALKLDGRNAEAWNNLGAVEYLDRGSRSAISDYRRAIKLDKRQAVFHANLATTYFEVQNFKGARREMMEALKLEPGIFDRKLTSGGIQAHVLNAQSRARLSFEMARMYASEKQEDAMLHSLGMACESGMDVQREMRKDDVLAQYENDPRVVILVHNALLLRQGHITNASETPELTPGASAAKPISE